MFKAVTVVAAIAVGSLYSTSALCDDEILFNRYDVLNQRDKLDIFQKTAKELDTAEGRVVVSAIASYFGIDPTTVNIAIAETARMIVPSNQQDMSGLIQTPEGYTICMARPANPNLGAGDKGIETHGDTTFDTRILRVVPGVNNFDGLQWLMVVPQKAGTDTRVNAVFDVTWVKADPGWQQKYAKVCQKTGDHPWLARNNETRLNVPCIPPNNAICRNSL